MTAFYGSQCITVTAVVRILSACWDFGSVLLSVGLRICLLSSCGAFPASIIIWSTSLYHLGWTFDSITSIRSLFRAIPWVVQVIASSAFNRFSPRQALAGLKSSRSFPIGFRKHFTEKYPRISAC